MADCKTLEGEINGLGAQISFKDRKPDVVIDAGIATADNLSGIYFLRTSLVKLYEHTFLSIP